jgi:Uncharacterized protein conserved in bacteria
MKKHSFLIFILLTLITRLSFCQSDNLNIRNIIVSIGDSLMKFNIKTKEPKIKIKAIYDYYWYYGGAINHNIGGFSGKLLDGKYEVFDNQQRLRSNGYYTNGLKQGIWNRWYGNGNLELSMKYKNGKLFGEMKTYGITGILLSVQNYKNDMLDGKSFYYQRDTCIVKNYSYGKEVIKKVKVKEKKAKDLKKQKIKVKAEPNSPSQQ